MSRWSCDSAQGDEEWDILSVSSIDDLLNKSLGDPESMAHSFVILSTPLWAPRRCVSVPSNLNYVFTSVSGSNGVSPSIPVDYPIPSEPRHDCDSGRTTPGDLSDNTTLTSSSQHDHQEGSGCTSPDELSEISSTSSSECDPYEESVKRRSSMHGKASSKKTLPLPEIIGAAVKTTTPVSVRDVIRTLTDPTIIVRVNPQERVSYIHWYAFFCDFWPVVMNRFRSDYSALPACLLEQYRRFFTLPSGEYLEAHIKLYQLLTPYLSEIMALDPYNKYVYDLLCYAYRAAYARYLFD
ncbi:hypothetical protein TSMEX_006376 [Taenia solium]|eukprot:TsM_000321600 transcript=TsM_000321600 gene=TsM_000321600